MLVFFSKNFHKSANEGDSVEVPGLEVTSGFDIVDSTYLAEARQLLFRAGNELFAIEVNGPVLYTLTGSNRRSYSPYACLSPTCARFDRIIMYLFLLNSGPSRSRHCDFTWSRLEDRKYTMGVVLWLGHPIVYDTTAMYVLPYPSDKTKPQLNRLLPKQIPQCQICIN
jgi:hypothetical protein